MADSFDRRKAIAAHAFGGEGIGGKRAQIIPHQSVLNAYRDPLTEGAETFSVGPRAFRLSGDVEAQPRPDLNKAFPYQLLGRDLGVTYQPTPTELALMDFNRRWRKDTGKTMFTKKGVLPKPGYFEHVMGYTPEGQSDRVYPRQQITEEWIKELQRSGFAQGGLVGEY